VALCGALLPRERIRSVDRVCQPAATTSDSFYDARLPLLGGGGKWAREIRIDSPATRGTREQVLTGPFRAHCVELVRRAHCRSVTGSAPRRPSRRSTCPCPGTGRPVLSGQPWTPARRGRPAQGRGLPTPRTSWSKARAKTTGPPRLTWFAKSAIPDTAVQPTWTSDVARVPPLAAHSRRLLVMQPHTLALLRNAQPLARVGSPARAVRADRSRHARVSHHVGAGRAGSSGADPLRCRPAHRPTACFHGGTLRCSDGSRRLTLV
jgi:hypothetical protein